MCALALRSQEDGERKERKGKSREKKNKAKLRSAPTDERMNE
jgi:hypothetical protein